MAPTQKWAMYTDGYNFSYAIKKRPEIAPIYLAWCDFGELASEIIRSRGTLIGIKYYFDSRVIFAARGLPIVKLVRYQLSFNLEEIS